MVATLGYVVGDRALATLLLQAAQTPEAEAAERLNQFYDEVRRLIERALEQGTALGLVRKCQPSLVAGALLGMVRGVIEVMMRGSEPLSVDEVVSEVIAVGCAACSRTSDAGSGPGAAAPLARRRARRSEKDRRGAREKVSRGQHCAFSVRRSRTH
ncbi:MAG: hypothetical protein IPI49_23760 [Myxococcales bacterium]|nr:hypothetical protein [Myxococcales bacterium]